MKNILLICCVAGKSAGHSIPCLQFATTQYLSQQPGPLMFISTTASVDTAVKNQFPAITHHFALDLEPIPYKKWWRLPLFVTKTIGSFFLSFYYLCRYKPSRIVSTGGFISIPVCIAAKLLRIPIDLIELNIVPGKAVLFLSRLATNLYICFTETERYFKNPCTLINYPLRFTTQDKLMSQDAALESLGLDPAKKTVLILGGSQGSQFLNNSLLDGTNTKFLKTVQIIHQTGAAHVQACQKRYQEEGILALVFSYKADLAPCYQAADIIICRAGAGTLFEAAFFQKNSMVIPLETATTDHQVDNAYALQKAHPHLFSVYLQKDLESDPDKLLTALQKQLATHQPYLGKSSPADNTQVLG